MDIDSSASIRIAYTDAKVTEMTLTYSTASCQAEITYRFG